MISSPSIERQVAVHANLVEDYRCAYAKQVAFVTEFQIKYVNY